jgi:hypothetical protein
MHHAAAPDPDPTRPPLEAGRARSSDGAGDASVGIVGVDPQRERLGLRVVEVDPQRESAWDAYAASHPGALPFHHSGWLASLVAEYDHPVVALACIDDRGTWRGLLPLLHTRGLPFGVGGRVGARRLASLPRTPLAGPLADDDAALGTLLAAAVARVREQPGTILQLKVSGELPAVALGPLHAQPWRQSFAIELVSDPDALRFGSSRQHGRITWAVRKAAREGLVVRPARTRDELRAWYRLYLDTMRWHMVPPRPFRLFDALWRHLHPQGLMTLLIAEIAGKLVAGSVYLDFAATRFYAFNGRRRDALHLRPNDALQWEAIRTASLEGRRRFDLGEVVDGHTGLADFKAKWGALPSRLVRYSYPDPARASSSAAEDSDAETHTTPGDDTPRPTGFIHAAWRRVPLPATALVGRVLYAFL